KEVVAEEASGSSTSSKSSKLSSGSKEGKSKEASDSSQAGGKELTVEATAYVPNCSGCSGITATGINVKDNPNMKVISVDPSVIPLGSKVWVEGYGEAIAG